MIIAPTDFRIVLCEACLAEGRILRGGNRPDPIDDGECEVCGGQGSEVIQVFPVPLHEVTFAPGEPEEIVDPFDWIYAARAYHRELREFAARETQLLKANNRMLDRARTAEREQEGLRAALLAGTVMMAKLGQELQKEMERK